MITVSAVNQQRESASFDPQVIESLTGIMSESAVQALVTDMVQDVRERLDRIAEVHVASSALKMIAQDAHDLKSMGGNFGLNEMAVRAGAVERAARSQCVDSVQATVPSLISVGRQSLKALSEHLSFTSGRVS